MNRLDAAALAHVFTGPDDAYAVQQLVCERAAKTSLGAPVGYKIGLSTDSAQRLYDIAEPISGRIFDSRLLNSGAHLVSSPRRRIGVECEVAVRLGKDLPPAGRSFDEVRVAGAVASFHAAIEILEDRFARSDGAAVWVLAADDMLGFGGVLGAALENFDPFSAHEGSVAIDGTQRLRGSTLDLQGGGPLSGLAWLANRLAAGGSQLSAGDVVFCGGLTAPLWIEPDGREKSVVTAMIDRMGTVEFVIEWSA